MKKTEALEELVAEETENLARAEQGVGTAFYIRDVIRNTLAAFQKKLEIAKTEAEKPKK